MGQKRYITLYHFCADFCLSSILENGLTMGGTPVFENGGLRVADGTQWLTADGDPDRQSWNTQNALPYSRTAHRLTINIPYSYRKKIIPVRDFMAQYPAENAGLVDGWPGSEHWFVYRGKIPPSWIVGIHSQGRCKEPPWWFRKPNERDYNENECDKFFRRHKLSF